MIRASKLARFALALLLLAVCYLNFWSYSRQEQVSPELFSDVAKGTAGAPQQYRILVVKVAWFLRTHTPLRMRHAFTILDAGAAFLAAFLLLLLMERSQVFREASPTGRLLGYVTYLFLWAYYLIWLTWYQRPETLPTACFVTLMVMLLGVRPKSAITFAGIAVATLSLAALQALVRADVSVCVYAGFGLASLLPLGKRLPQPRAFLLPLCAVAVLLAAATQWVLMHRIYPNATYGDTAVIQILTNVTPQSLLTFAVFAAPLGWTVACTLASARRLPPEFLALLFGAAIFLPLWATVGRIQEVRIFLPFTLTLAPLTACCLMLRAQPDEAPVNELTTPS